MGALADQRAAAPVTGAPTGVTRAPSRATRSLMRRLAALLLRLWPAPAGVAAGPSRARPRPRARPVASGPTRRAPRRSPSPASACASPSSTATAPRPGRDAAFYYHGGSPVVRVAREDGCAPLYLTECEAEGRCYPPRDQEPGMWCCATAADKAATAHARAVHCRIRARARRTLTRWLERGFDAEGEVAVEQQVGQLHVELGRRGSSRSCGCMRQRTFTPVCSPSGPEITYGAARDGILGLAAWPGSARRSRRRTTETGKPVAVVHLREQQLAAQADQHVRERALAGVELEAERQRQREACR